MIRAIIAACPRSESRNVSFLPRKRLSRSLVRTENRWGPCDAAVMCAPVDRVVFQTVKTHGREKRISGARGDLLQKIFPQGLKPASLLSLYGAAGSVWVRRCVGPSGT